MWYAEWSQHTHRQKCLHNSMNKHLRGGERTNTSTDTRILFTATQKPFKFSSFTLKKIHMSQTIFSPIWNRPRVRWGLNCFGKRPWDKRLHICNARRVSIVFLEKIDEHFTQTQSHTWHITHTITVFSGSQPSPSRKMFSHWSLTLLRLI